ncbi:MAG: HAD-IIA family hydrolase [Nocardiaceae bacterium]|nr:HAD-IIA family hydrolase [Nocardiaceae bacterium]
MMSDRLRDNFGVLLFDLDGTLYVGHEPIASAVAAVGDGDQRQLYVTNNASRSAADVAATLRGMGYVAGDDDVVTSAQAAARILAAKLEPGSKVLVVGTESFVDCITEVGLTPIRTSEGAVAVAQGHNPETAWPILAEATYAIRAGAFWVASNTDATLPLPRGLAPGNGSMVAALRTSTGETPVVAGKPYPPLIEDALSRHGGSRDALVIGDRLDTDIAGGHSTNLPSLLVLTGVATAESLFRAVPHERPTYVGLSMVVLNEDSSRSRIEAKDGVSVEVVDGDLVVSVDATVDAQCALAAATFHAWELSDFGAIRGADAYSTSIVAQWPL